MVFYAIELQIAALESFSGSHQPNSLLICTDLPKTRDLSGETSIAKLTSTQGLMWGRMALAIRSQTHSLKHSS